MLSASQAAMFRKLTLGDESLMRSLFAETDAATDALGDQATSLIRLGALVIADADPPAYQREVRQAVNAGASPEQITSVLYAVARIAGSALVMSAAPKLAIALGYDVDAGLEDAATREGDT
jgi:4-carboxymuconolactone decarboxylase